MAPHRFGLTEAETTRWGSIWITRPKRSILDTLAILPEDEAHSFFGWAITRQKLTAPDIEQHLELWPGRAGNRRLHKFLASAASGALSEAEVLAHRILRRAQITGWSANTAVSDAAGIIGLADILFAREHLVVEIDGLKFHGLDKFQSDRTRQNRLVRAGFVVLRYTWQDLTQRPHDFVTQVRTQLQIR